MNAYQLPFNTGSSTSPFFAQNGHSYGVISPSYGSPRSTNISPAHKNMSSQTSFVPPSNYFHPQSHLQPFTSFASSVQSANNANNLYTHNQYNAYASASSPSLANPNSPNNFDYGYNSTNLSGSGAYSYISNTSTPSYSPYSQAAAINASTAPGSIPSSNSISYHSPTSQPDSYLCNIKSEIAEDHYSVNVNKVDLPLQPVKKAKKSGRGRGRRNVNPSPSPDNIIDRIFVWYIDDTVLAPLTLAEFNRFISYDTSPEPYREINNFITKIAEKYLFFDDLKEIDQSHIEDFMADDNGQDLSNYDFRTDGFKSSVSCNIGSTRNSADLRQKMALRYRKISEIYRTFGEKVNDLLEKSEQDQMHTMMRRLDLNSKHWHQSASKALSFIKTKQNCLNVLITSSSLIYALAKVLVFNLAPFFSIGNIYSCSKTSKEHTLNRILNRFGSNCTYIVVGKGQEEKQLSQKLELPFWPVSEKEHFESLLSAMHYYF